jgi:hypothetical protein
MSFLKVSPKGTILVDYVAGYLSGVTTIHIDGFTQATSLLKKDSVFTLGTGTTEHTVSADVRVLSSECDVTFTPATTVALTNDTAVVFKTDVRDAVISEFNLTYPTDYIALVDAEILSQAERLGIYTESDIYTPLHDTIKRYAIAWLCAEVACDKTGVNNIDTPDIEKYAVKYDIYKRKADDLAKKLNYEMFSNDISAIVDTVVTQGTLYRG